MILFKSLSIFHLIGGCSLYYCIFRNDISSALLFITDIYNGRVKDKTKNGDLRSRISLKISDLIHDLLHFTVDGCSNGTIGNLVDHYKVRLE